VPGYEVLLRRRAEKQLDRVPYVDHPRLVKAMLALGDDPRPPGCLQLLDDIYRIRVGAYRVIYKIDDQLKEVVVGKVARRREDTYRVIVAALSSASASETRSVRQAEYFGMWADREDMHGRSSRAWLEDLRSQHWMQQ